MKERINALLYEVLRYLKRVMLIVLGITVVAALSFLITGGFTAQAFSDRMFWAGVFSMIVGGIGAISLMNLNRTVLGIPNVITRQEDARKLMEGNLKLREAIEKRYDFGILFWAIGLVCMGISALITLVSVGLGVK